MVFNADTGSSSAVTDKELTAASEVETLTRIFVGGLGETVNAGDLRWLFNSLGVVEAVDIVRTKGRSFAYVNFLPSAPKDKSLAKLFSTYNGCLWKGGKLRLERAKEHYQVRLKREWAEDAEHVNHERKADFDPFRAKLPRQFPDKTVVGKEFLRIFFPRLRKIKSVPLNGTGKHKYSFQHVEVPALPINFCDCEEHSGPAFSLEEKLEEQHDLGAKSGGMNGEEVRIMDMVMNKLFERGNVSNHMPCDNEKNYLESIEEESDRFEVESALEEDDLITNVVRVKRGKIPIGSRELKTTKEKQDFGFDQASSSLEQVQIEMKPDGYEVDTLSDEDDLMMNIVTEKRKSSAGSKEQRMILGKQGSELIQTASVKNSTHDALWKHKKIITPHKKRNSVECPENNNTGFTSHVPGDDNEEFPLFLKSKTLHLEANGKAGVELAKAEAIPRAAENLHTDNSTISKSSGAGASWWQKSSWTQLVGENNSSFNTYQILPSIFQKPVALQSDTLNMDTVNLAETHQDIVQEMTKAVGDSNGSALGKERNEGLIQSCKKLNQDETEKEAGANPVGRKGNSLLTTTFASGGEARPFERSSTSLREWKKLKDALSRSRKRKRSGDA